MKTPGQIAHAARFTCNFPTAAENERNITANWNNLAPEEQEDWEIIASAVLAEASEKGEWVEKCAEEIYFDRGSIGIHSAPGNGINAVAKIIRKHYRQWGNL